MAVTRCNTCYIDFLSKVTFKKPQAHQETAKIDVRGENHRTVVS